MRTLHEQLALAINDTDLMGDEPIVELDYNEAEYDHPETLIRRTDELDQNIEVIYCEDGELALIQENGNDGKGRTGFVWTRVGWTDEVIKKYVIPWLASL